MDEQQAQKINEAAKEFSDALAASYRALSNRTVSNQQQSAQLTQEFFEAVINNLQTNALPYTAFSTICFALLLHQWPPATLPGIPRTPAA